MAKGEGTMTTKNKELREALRREAAHLLTKRRRTIFRYYSCLWLPEQVCKAEIPTYNTPDQTYGDKAKASYMYHELRATMAKKAVEFCEVYGLEHSYSFIEDQWDCDWREGCPEESMATDLRICWLSFLVASL